VAAAICGALLTAGGAAEAQQPSKEELAKARTAFQEGVALAAANNCAAALVKYKEVAQVKMTAQVAFNIAECEERLGKLVQALGNYRIAVSQAGEDKNLQKVLREAGSRVEDIEARIPKLTIKKGPGIDTATILLDGTELGASQIGSPMPLDPGAHVVVGKFEGKEYFNQNVTVAEKENKIFTVRFELPKVKVETVPVEPPPTEAPPPPPKSRVPGAVVTAVGGVALITGLAGIGVRQSAISTLNGLCQNNKCPDTDEAHSAVSKGKTMTGVAEIMIPVGVGALAAGIYLLATSGPQKPKADDKKEAPADKPAAFAPKMEFVGWAPGASVGGLSVVGRF
jgi:hypothetical protein